MHGFVDPGLLAAGVDRGRHCISTAEWAAHRARLIRVPQSNLFGTVIQREASVESNVVLAKYKFVDIFPTEVSAIDLSYDSSDAIEEFTVTFQVQSLELLGDGGAVSG